MRFSVETEDLCAAISTVTKALSARTTVSILEGIYMEAEGAELLMRCTDLSLQIETEIPSDVSEEGAIVMPGRLFSEMARKLPGEEIYISSDKNTVSIESGRARTTVQCEKASAFHIMPPVREEFAVSISSSALKKMIKQCIFATAQDDSKPILTGVLAEIENDTLSFVALDGYRLAKRVEKISGLNQNESVVMPARSLLEISRILGDGDETIKLVFSRTHVMIDLGKTKITTRLLDGEYIKYRHILPDKWNTRMRINRSEMLDSIERVSLMAREGKSNLIKFSIKKDAIIISANSEVGKSDEEIPIDLTGDELEIAFNSRYFSDVLKALDDEYLYLDINNNTSPCVVTPVQGSAFYYLILPVRLFSGV